MGLMARDLRNKHPTLKSIGLRILKGWTFWEIKAQGSIKEDCLLSMDLSREIKNHSWKVKSPSLLHRWRWGQNLCHSHRMRIPEQEINVKTGLKIVKPLSVRRNWRLFYKDTFISQNTMFAHQITNKTKTQPNRVIYFTTLVNSREKQLDHNNRFFFLIASVNTNLC